MRLKTFEEAKRSRERVYISGMITGLDRDIFVARFMEAERLLKQAGYEQVVNPVRFLVSKPFLFHLVGYKLTLLYDMWRMMHCRRIYLIPGWEDSRGARIESFTAYQMHIRRLPQEVKEGIDKKMEHYLGQEWSKVKTSNLQPPSRHEDSKDNGR